VGEISLERLVAPDAAWVSRQVIGDPEIYAKERTRIFERCWLVVAHESQLPAPGDFVASTMGEEPVIVQRDRDGTVRVFLNSCSHRASRICRTDRGNASTWICPNHGWAFATDGRLLAIPQILEGYGPDFDRASRSLLSARTDVYRGFIFATFDERAPDLVDYLGDAARYLDTVYDRYEGGVEVLGGQQKVVVDSNWKLVAENLGTDLQHPEVAHGAFMEMWPDPVMSFMKESEQVLTSAGHPICIGRQLPPYTERESALALASTAEEEREIHEWFDDSLAYASKHLGDLYSGLYVFTGGIFPNLSFLPGINAVYLCHPRGPLQTEWWSWCVVPAQAPKLVKEAMRSLFMLASGPGGIILAEDVENWADMTRSSLGEVGARMPFDVSRGLGEEYTDPELPGSFATMRSEHAQRAFWRNWRRSMSA